MSNAIALTRFYLYFPGETGCKMTFEALGPLISFGK